MRPAPSSLLSLCVAAALAALWPWTARAQGAIPPAPGAQLVAVHGAVTVTSRGEHPAALAERLRANAVVRTGPAGAADIEIEGGARVRLGPDSALVVFPLRRNVALNDPAARPLVLLHGTLRWEFAPAAPSPRTRALVVVATPLAQIALGPGVTRVTAEAAAGTAIVVDRGAAQVREGARRVRLREHMALRIGTDHRPSPPAHLPGPPAWTATPPRLALIREPTADVTGRFTPEDDAATGVAQWRVVLSRDAPGQDPVTDERLPADARAVALRGVAPGRYFVRVAALDASGFEGESSPVAPFDLAALRVVPGAPGRRAAIEPVPGLRCGLDGQSLSEMHAAVALVPGGAHTLRCALAADGVDAVEALITPAEAGPLVHRVRVEPAGYSPGGGERTLVVQLSDALGTPIAYADIDATATPGAVMNALRESPTRGTYTGTIRWRAGLAAVQVRFVVNRVEAFEYTLGP